MDVPVQGALLVRIKVAGKPAQVAVQRRHFVLWFHWGHAGAQQRIAQLEAALLELNVVFASQVKGDAAAIELVLAPQKLACGSDILAGQDGGLSVANSLTRQLLQVAFQGVLRRHHQRDAERGVLRQLVEQGVEGIASLTGFTGQVPSFRRFPQAIEHHDTMRQTVEVPKTFVDVRYRLAVTQVLREISPAGERQFTFKQVRGRLADGFIEAAYIRFGGAEMIRPRVEPADQPMTDGVAIHALGFDAGIGQAAQQAIADDLQVGTGVLATYFAVGLPDPPVNDQADATLLPSPG
ncbi:hypothetical protein D3C84_618240 [compost metagenome]